MRCINEKIKLGNFKRLGTRLLLGFGFVLILVTVLSVVNLSSIYRINQDTSETFRQIDDSIGHVAGSIQEITNELTTMLGVGQSLSTSVEEIASISEESAAGVEQTSASAEEVSSSMEEILTSSADLTKLANQLNGLLGQFKL